MTAQTSAPDTPPAQNSAEQATEQPASTWADLITTVLARRSNSRFNGYTAAVRSAAVQATERFAYAHTEPFLSGLTKQQRIGARRAQASAPPAPARTNPPPVPTASGATGRSAPRCATCTARPPARCPPRSTTAAWSPTRC